MADAICERTARSGVDRLIERLGLDQHPAQASTLGAVPEDVRLTRAADANDADITGVESETAFSAADLPVGFHGEPFWEAPVRL